MDFNLTEQLMIQKPLDFCWIVAWVERDEFSKFPQSRSKWQSLVLWEWWLILNTEVLDDSVLFYNYWNI
jgi:hypothetical protein